MALLSSDMRLVLRKQIPVLQLAGLALVWSFLIASGLAQSGASYTVQRRIDTITVDGNLNETSWANALTTSVLTLWDGSPAPASLRTSAQMVWDDDYLYIAFTAKDPDIYATYTGRDVHCWEQDCFEVFVTVPGTTAAYLEMDGSPKGAIWDGYFTNVLRGIGEAYTVTNLQIAARVNGTLNNSSDQDIGFTAEVRVPFENIYQGQPGGHPTNGTQLRLNLYRIDWNTPATQGGRGATGSDTYYAWSPVSGTAPSFHQPSKFGTVTFSTNFVSAPAWMFDPPVLLGTNLVLSGVGHPGGAYRVLVSDNPAVAMSNWTQSTSDNFDSVTGRFRFTNAIDPGKTQLFYRLGSP